MSEQTLETVMKNEAEQTGVPIIEVRNVKKYFPVKGGIFNRKKNVVKAVDDLSFSMMQGETFGIVGESGSGKSTLGRTILRLTEPTAGNVLYEGKDISHISAQEMRAYRRHMQMVFQDPFSSLNPRMRVGELIEEPMVIHRYANVTGRKERIRSLLDTVGLPKEAADKFPHEFSGGQRQRIGIARSLAIQPKFIIADEPVSALDVSIQSQILNLISDLQDEFDLTYLFIAHDLSVVKHISDRIGVMYLGKMMELAPKKNLFDQPLHPYTRSLLSAVPIPNPHLKRERIILKGDIPSPVNPPSGCVFRTRCPVAFDKCEVKIPTLQHVEDGHYVACHLYDHVE